MSEKWETVGTGKSTSRKITTGSKTATTKPAKKEKMVYTMEDILPASSVVNSFASAFDPVPTPKSPKKEANGGAKVSNGKAKSTAKVEKPCLPASLEEAVKAKIKLDELRSIIEEVQQRWPDSPLLWLRDVAQYLNFALVTSQEEELCKEALGGEPLSALTANMRKVIAAMLSRCEEGMRETFFETCVANTAHELAKGGNVAGWRCLTQLLADLQPTVVTAHLPRYVELRNSYQNRPAVGLAILWSVGQAGRKSLQSGIKVWLEVMLPVITFRHYTKYVVDYLAALLAVHNITPDTQMNKPLMDISNFITVQDTVFVVSSAMNKEHARSLQHLYPRLRAIALGGFTNHELFPALLPRLDSLASPGQVVDTLEVLAECLAATPAARVHWTQAYTSNLGPSGQLLSYLDSNWIRYRADLDEPELQETIEAFQDYNASVVNKEGLQLATEGANAVAAHFSTPGMAWFPWKTLSLLLLIGTAAIINLDMERSGGSFKASNTGQFLSDLGQYERVMGAGTWVMVSTKQGRQWVEVTLPPYLAHGRKVAGPYLELAAAKANEAGNIAKLGLERVREASKLGLARLEAAVPGLGVRMEEFGTEASRLGVLAVAKGREVAVNAREGLALLLSGKVDWSAVRIQLAEAVEVAQKQLLAAANYVQLQLKQLVK